MAHLEFNDIWYNNLIENSNEKKVLSNFFKEFISNNKFESCLEIGLGTTTHFLDQLSSLFDTYTIVEKEEVKLKLPKKVELINDDFEHARFTKKYNLIIASHVIYYFKDKESAIKKMRNLLNENGKIIFIVNGKDGDYGPLKLYFSKLINKPYVFTYDELKEILFEYKIEEVSLKSRLLFKSEEELFNALRLSFDVYPNEYKINKEKIKAYFRKNIKDEFIINQKVLIYSKSEWENLIHHDEYKIDYNGIEILVKDKVFTPDFKITNSTNIILKNLPNIKNKSILDLGCGTGIIGVYCSKHGAKVLCSDISDDAIENTKININWNKCKNITTIKSNLFENIDKRFDYIFANLPILDEAWTELKIENLIQRFLIDSKKHINIDGEIYLVWASFGDVDLVESILKKLNYDYDCIKEEKLGHTWYLFKIEIKKDEKKIN